MKNEQTTVFGKIEGGGCHVQVAFGRWSPTGCHWRDPEERTVLDLGNPGIVIPGWLAKEMGLEVEVINAAPPGKRAKWSPNVKGIVNVCYELRALGGLPLWRASANAVVMPVETPSLGMGQLLKWHLTIDGPAGNFELRVPRQT